MAHVSRLTQQSQGPSSSASRLTRHLSRLNFDTLIGSALFLAGLYAYISTLAPTVLEGDAALFQYTPYVMGVTYPTGYPLYILLGKLWVSLLPFGEMAWRMNLFSALCSAAALPLIYGATKRLLTPLSSREGAGERFTALITVLTFATLPTFWRWSTEAKIYALNILLFSTVLYTLALALEKPNQKLVITSNFPWRRLMPHLSRITPHLALALPAFLLGLQMSVHSTTMLLIPGLLLLAWLRFGAHPLNKKVFLSSFFFLLAPGLLYLYIPLRAEWLIATFSRSEAIAHGLLADFYHSGPAGWVRYFTAADFTGGVVTNWGLVPQNFLTVYLPLLGDDFTPVGMGLGIVGGLGLAVMRPRLFWPLFLIYAVPIPFVLTYGQGEQSAFLLPSFLIFSIFVGNFLPLITRLIAYFPPSGSRFTLHTSRLIALLLFLMLILLLFLPQIRYNVNWLNAKWDRANYNYWADVLTHPLEPGATLLAQWGDLTSFWYMQHAEGRRPDLRGLYPPTEEMVINHLHNGSELYIASPGSKAWAAGIEDDYQLLPWGRLVRLAPKEDNPQILLPRLPHAQTAVFDHKLRLLGADYAPLALDGRPYGVTLTWQALADLPPETTLSLRLSQGDVIAAQLDDTLVSGWFPHPRLSSGQFGLSHVPIPIPLGTLPGKYRLQLVVYISYKQPWPLANGTSLLDLGEVELTIPSPSTRPDTALMNPTPGYDFNGEIQLVDYRYSANRVGQGKGFAVELLWQAQTKPADNYTLSAELVDAAGNVLRSLEHQPVGGRAPTAGWQAGQFVQDQVDLVLPASAPTGQEAVRVRLAWLRPDGSKLKIRRWLVPVGEKLNLNWLEVTEEERNFEAPPIQFLVDVNLDNKVRLLGYNTSLLLESNRQVGFQWSPEKCEDDAEACQIHFDLYWQGLNEMDTLYFVFLHLVDEQGQIVAQQDKGPGLRGKEPTTSWLPGEVITDPVDLVLQPERIPPGLYTLRLGMYLPSGGERLPVLDQAGQPAANYVEIGTIEVTR